MRRKAAPICLSPICLCGRSDAPDAQSQRPARLASLAWVASLAWLASLAWVAWLAWMSGKWSTVRVGLFVLCAIIMGGWTANPATAGEPTEEFLDALRAAGYHDEALLYLDKMTASTLATVNFKQAVLYQRGLTLIAASRRATDNNQRTQLLEQAEKSLEEFVENHSTHDLLTEAQIQLGNVLVDKADQQMALGQRSNNQTLIDAARKSFQGAHVYFIKIRDDLDEKLERVNKIQFDPSQREQKAARERMREDYLQSLVYVASVLEAAAEAEAEGSAERKKLLEDAAAEFGTIYEAYRRRTVGLYSRLYQARCLQKLGQELDALSLYTDLFDQPDTDPVFRDVKLQAMELAMRIWLDDEHKKYAEAVNRSTVWLRSADREEQNTQRGCSIRLSAARANKMYAEYLDEKQPGNTQSAQLRADARDIALELTKVRNPYQQDARLVLAALRGEMGVETTEIPKGTTFASARDLANEAMTEFQNAGYLVAKLPERIRFEKDEEEKKKLGIRMTQADEDLQRFRAQALVNLELALKFADEDTPQDELNLIRVFLAQIYLSHGDYFDTAVIGEFLARHYATTPPAKPAAQLALSAYQQIARTTPTSSDFANAKLKDLAEYMLETWAQDPEAEDAALVLISFAVADGDLDKSRDLLERIPETGEKRGVAERMHGFALWAAFSRATNGKPADAPLEESEKALAAESMEVLAAGCSKLTSDQPIDYQTALSVLALAQAYLKNAKPVEAMKIIDTPGYGSMELIAGNGPLAKNPPLIEETLRTALLAYVGASNEDGATMKIKTTMVALKKHIGNDAEGKARLISILIKVAQSLQGQLASATPDQRAMLSQSFATFLEQVSKEAADFQTLFWVGDSFRSLAMASDKTEGPPPAQAKVFYEQSHEVYEDILIKGDADQEFYTAPSASVQVKLRLVSVKRRLLKYKDAMQLLVEILSERPTMVHVQKEAAMTYQQWGGFKGSSALYLKAVAGAYPNEERKNTVWGWARIAVLTQGNEKFSDDYFNARLQMATCRYRYALEGKSSNKSKYLNYAKQDIVFTYRKFPALGGEESEAEFDALLRRIQASLKEPQKGLAALKSKKK